MKSIFKITAAVCFIAMATLATTGKLCAQVTAPDPTNLIQQFTIKIDKLGDATWELSQTMTQAQWENFKSSPIATDPSIARRNMERSMSTYVVEDFNRDLDEMNRSVKITCKVKAFAQYDGGGDWELKLDSKNPQVSKLADNSYMITSNVYYGNTLAQEIFKIYFPAGASNIQQTTDSFGKAVFTYSKGGGMFSYLTWNNILGILFIAAAIYLVIRQQKPTAQPQTKTA